MLKKEEYLNQNNKVYNVISLLNNGDKLKKYGRNWWICKKDYSLHCPICGKKADTVLRTKSNVKKDRKIHTEVLFLECNHNERMEKEHIEKHNIPTKFKLVELVRFPRTIGEMKE